MVRKITLFMIVSVFILLPGCGNKTIDSQWTDQKISVDGIAADWQNFKLQNYDKQDMFLGITNDKDNLYLLISFKGLALSRRFSMSGLTVWLDDENKKKKVLGVRLVPEMDPRQRLGENIPAQMPEEMRLELEERQKNLIRGLTVTTNGGVFYKLDDAENIPRGSYSNENDAITTELAIPLEESSITPFAIGSNPGSKMKIGFEIGGSQALMKNRSSMTGSMGARGGMSGGMGGRGGRGGRGGMSGGRGGMTGGMRNTSQSAQFQDIWLSANLAVDSEKK